MKNLLFIFASFIMLLAILGNTFAYEPQATWVEREMKIFAAQSQELNPRVLRYGLNAYLTAQTAMSDSSRKKILTIIDYSKEATQHRLWVLDLQNNRILFNTWVSHGSNSGHYNFATSFSNQFESHKSSLGVFITGDTYQGKEGLSLKLKGLEKGVNDNAEKRNIVIHGAWYVGENTIKSYHTVGHSWGCPAVSQAVISPLVNTIKNGTVVFSYYPDNNYLVNSKFLVAHAYRA